MSILAVSRSVPAGMRRRSYQLVRPEHIEHALPLILCFHGSGESGSALRKELHGSLDRLVDEGRTVVAYLDAFKGHWNDARRGSDFAAREQRINDVGFARAVVAQLSEEGKVDGGRVIALGHSQGGQMVLRLMHDAPELLSGAFISGTTMPAPANWLSKGEAGVMPLLILAGTDDPCSPYLGGDASLFGFHSRGEHLSSVATAEYFAHARGLGDAPVISQPPHRPESGEHAVTVRQWGDGRSLVRHYTIEGGGHRLPAHGQRAQHLLLGSTTTDIDTGEELDRFLLDK